MDVPEELPLESFGHVCFVDKDEDEDEVSVPAGLVAVLPADEAWAKPVNPA